MTGDGLFDGEPEATCECCKSVRPVGWVGLCEPCWDYVTASDRRLLDVSDPAPGGQQ